LVATIDVSASCDKKIAKRLDPLIGLLVSQSWHWRDDTKKNDAPFPVGVVVDSEKVFLLVGIRKGIQSVKLQTRKLLVEISVQPAKPGLPGKWPLK